MKKILTCLIVGLSFVGCSPTPYKERSQEEKLRQIEINVLDYVNANLKSDLALSNYMVAYQREKEGVNVDAKQTPYDDIHFMTGSKDTVEVSLLLPNTGKEYARNAKDQPIFSTGLHFAIDENGKIKDHKGYVCYFGSDTGYTLLTGQNANLLYNSFKK